ncbi:YczE/YyaS/YitT family protein [Tindallia californiensis]|uniref:Uncharacterized membrane protein YczE n=1 Tax=Tindallia californiensis TaxID=159292 RepID=A0A1H3LCU7_9FIRM|nr:hypothetical protein [Tindallia californiensis]SDY62211.1 Uncharacterized membrane protein YczE [Tindallia californiensis]
MKDPTQRHMMYRIIRMIIGFAVFAAGIVMTIHGNIGLAPWDVFHQGLSKTLGITIGQASIGMGLLIVILDVIFGEKIGWGTLGNMLFIGLFIDFYMINEIIPIQNTFWLGVIQVLAGLFVIGIGSFLYISVGLGCGPRDGLMVALVKRTKRPVGVIRGSMEGIALVTGWLLGGHVGLGTLLIVLTIGPMVQFAFHLFRFDVANLRHQFIDEDLKALKKKREKERR